MPRKAEPVDPETLNAAQRNISKLVKDSEMSVNAWALHYGLQQTTINRIVRGEHDPTAGYLQQVADAISAKSARLEVWQLMAPDLGQGLAKIRVQDGEPVAVPITIAAERVSTTTSKGGVRRQTSWPRKAPPAAAPLTKKKAT